MQDCNTALMQCHMQSTHTKIEWSGGERVSYGRFLEKAYTLVLQNAPSLGARCHLQFVCMMHSASSVKLTHFHLVKSYPKVELQRHHALYEANERI